MTQAIAGRYTLLREVGRGGMGAVWLARDEVLDREVALKRLANASHAEAAARVEREARVSAMLNHPHVVAVFDLAEDGGESWLVMEYVESVTLSAAVRERGPLTPDATAHLLAQAASALAAAHRAGVVHRDVKPGNMLVSPTGHLKLGDFGIARAGADPSLTATGLVTGSPAYLAPEVAAGGTATPASDMWSLGASVFHAVAGAPPYDTTDNLMGVLYRLVNDEPPRTDRAGWLDPVLRHTMERDPARRWSAEQVHDFLAHGARPVSVARPTRAATPPAPAERTQSLPRTSPPGRGRAGWVAAAVVALAVLTFGGWWLGRDGNDPGRSGSTAVTTPSAPSTSASPAPDAAAMEAFVDDYLTVAVEDPPVGFARLTPDYRRASGGLSGYRGWWDTVQRADLLDAEADVEQMTVTYRVRYTLRGSPNRTEKVVVDLVMDGDDYLIADARTITSSR